jgi:hypothetical protein
MSAPVAACGLAGRCWGRVRRRVPRPAHAECQPHEWAKLTASDAGANNYDFGLSVAVSGDTAVIGADCDDALAGTEVGSAYVFDLTCSAPGDLYGDVDEADFAEFQAAFPG